MNYFSSRPWLLLKFPCSINFSDFAYEIWTSLVFFVDWARGKPHTRSPKDHPGGVNFSSAFGLNHPDDGANVGMTNIKSNHEPFMAQNGRIPSREGSIITSQPKARPMPRELNGDRAV